MKQYLAMGAAVLLLLTAAGCGARESVEAEEPPAVTVEDVQDGDLSPESAPEEKEDSLLDDLDLSGLLGGDDETSDDGGSDGAAAADPDATTGQQNALASAEAYLDFMAFSRDGLIGQLEYEGYTTEEAAYAADHCGADWNEQAVAVAERYLDVMSFSRDGLIDQLEYEGFTPEQAVYGVDAVYGAGTGGDDGSTTGQQNALASAGSYLQYSAFSYEGLVEQLEFEGYSHEEAVYAADHCGADWNEQAARSAEQYLSFSSFSRQELIDQLEFEGFTNEQAVYGVTQNGY